MIYLLLLGAFRDCLAVGEFCDFLNSFPVLQTNPHQAILTSSLCWRLVNVIWRTVLFDFLPLIARGNSLNEFWRRRLAGTAEGRGSCWGELQGAGWSWVGGGRCWRWGGGREAAEKEELVDIFMWRDRALFLKGKNLLSFFFPIFFLCLVSSK